MNSLSVKPSLSLYNSSAPLHDSLSRRDISFILYDVFLFMTSLFSSELRCLYLGLLSSSDASLAVLGARAPCQDGPFDAPDVVGALV